MCGGLGKPVCCGQLPVISQNWVLLCYTLTPVMTIWIYFTEIVEMFYSFKSCIGYRPVKILLCKEPL